MHTIVGRDVTPLVGMTVCEILGGFGASKHEDSITTGDRTGTISKVRERCSEETGQSAENGCTKH